MRPRSFLLIVLLLATTTGWSAFAFQERYISVAGKLVDGAGLPVEAFRVMFQPTGEAHTFISGPSGPDGEFLVSLPEGGEFVPVGLVTDRGRRQELPDLPAFRAEVGHRVDITLPSSLTGFSVEMPDDFAAVEGRIQDAAEQPVAGCRVVFRAPDEALVYISQPSGEDGSYVVALPEGQEFTAVAVINPAGQRTALEGQATVEGEAGARHDVALPVVVPKGQVTGAKSFPGADRLYLSFVEDTAVTDKQRLEFLFDYASFDAAVQRLSLLRGAFQVKGMADVELGFELGFGNFQFDNGPKGSGVTDLEISFKWRIYQSANGRSEWAAGFRSILPTGDADAGLGRDAFGMSWFGAYRRNLRWGLVSVNLGFDGRDNGSVRGIPLAGEIAPTGGVAVIARLGQQVNFIAELKGTGELFQNTDPDGRLLAGINWGIRQVTIRAAAIAGLTDGAPDLEIRAGVAFEF